MEPSNSIVIASDGEVSWARVSRTHLAALALCIIVLFVCYNRFARTFPRDSDDAAFVLEAQDILRGNVLLHGWNLPPDTFYATITPWYVVGALVTAKPADLMYFVPSLIYAILVGLLMTIVWTKSDGAHRIGAVLVIFAIVAMPPGEAGPPTGTSTEHTTTTLFVVATFYLLDIGAGPALGAIPLALAMIGDPMAIFIGTIPLVVVGGCRLYFDRSDHRCLVAAAVATLFSMAVWIAIPHFGGFSSWPVSTQFAPVSVIMRKAILFSRYLLSLFGVGLSSLAALLTAPPRLAMVVLVACAIYGVAVDMLKGGKDILMQLSAIAIAITAGAYVTSVQAADWASVRYIIPIVIFGGLLAGLWWYRIGISTRYVFPVILLAVIVNCATFVRSMLRPRVEFPQAVISYLTQANLREGYGGYWDANLLSVASGGNLTIGPVGMGNEGKLVFFPWYASDELSRMHNARFLIFSTDMGGVSQDAATSTWGPPAEIKTIGKYHLLIWNSPLSIGNPFSRQ